MSFRRYLMFGPAPRALGIVPMAPKPQSEPVEVVKTITFANGQTMSVAEAERKLGGRVRVK